MKKVLLLLKALWMRFAHAVGIVNTYIILTVFYGVILLPFGIIARIARSMRETKKRDTYWIEKPVEDITLASLKQPF